MTKCTKCPSWIMTRHAAWLVKKYAKRNKQTAWTTTGNDRSSHHVVLVGYLWCRILSSPSSAHHRRLHYLASYCIISPWKDLSLHIQWAEEWRSVNLSLTMKSRKQKEEESRRIGDILRDGKWEEIVNARISTSHSPHLEVSEVKSKWGRYNQISQQR